MILVNFYRLMCIESINGVKEQCKPFKTWVQEYCIYTKCVLGLQFHLQEVYWITVAFKNVSRQRFQLTKLIQIFTPSSRFILEACCLKLNKATTIKILSNDDVHVHLWHLCYDPKQISIWTTCAKHILILVVTLKCQILKINVN